jgi:hypothetical protein
MQPMRVEKSLAECRPAEPHQLVTQTGNGAGPRVPHHIKRDGSAGAEGTSVKPRPLRGPWTRPACPHKLMTQKEMGVVRTRVDRPNEAHPSNRPTISEMFCPPKPKLLERALLQGASRATLGM